MYIPNYIYGIYLYISKKFCELNNKLKNHRVKQLVISKSKNELNTVAERNNKAPKLALI